MDDSVEITGPLPPIPIPWRRRWREFRMRWLPVVVFVALVGSVVIMWDLYVQPAAVLGEVESVHANLVSSVAGTVEALHVQRFQRVTNGQAVAVISVLDADQREAELAVIAADQALLKGRMDLDRARNLDAVSRLRLDLQGARREAGLAAARLQHAEAEFGRSERLFKDQLIAGGQGLDRNDYGHDVAVRDREMARAELAAAEANVAQLEADLRELEASGTVTVGSHDPLVEAAIVAQQRRFERLMKPVVLRSPINGFVSSILSRPGERITAGLPILVVSQERAEHIVGWVRQPVQVRPQPGDVVEVRRGQFGQRSVLAEVIRVGTQLEPITPTLLPPSANPNRVELGLPFLIRAPEELDLIPGETVELNLHVNAGRSGN